MVLNSMMKLAYGILALSTSMRRQVDSLIEVGSVSWPGWFEKYLCEISLETMAKKEDGIRLADSLGEIKVYAKLDEVGNAKHVQKELVH